MTLIKDSETGHFLVTGSTGSGKTNLINTLLPQVRDAKHPAIVVAQTGEMIERYYDPNRGNIIFNPLDARSHSWDFWQDVTSNNVAINDVDPRLKKFAKVFFLLTNELLEIVTINFCKIVVRYYLLHVLRV